MGAPRPRSGCGRPFRARFARRKYGRAEPGASRLFEDRSTLGERRHPRLAILLAADGKVDGLLSEADRLDRQGKSEEAAKLVEGQATTALNEARMFLQITTVDTPWAKEHRAQIEKLFADRAASMPTYAASLRSSDPVPKIEALVGQATLEKRALGIAASIRKKQSPP